MSTVKWVKFNGIKFVADHCYVPVGYENGLSLFAGMKKIVWKNEQPIFVCTTVNTIRLDFQLMAYEVNTTEIFELHTLQSVVAHSILHCHQIDGKKYIIVKQLWGDLF